MKAELTDGRIVNLDADYCQCGCGTIFTKGPCWLRIDQYARDENRKLLDSAREKIENPKNHSDLLMAGVLLDRFAELELVRLKYKQYYMMQYGIIRLITNEQPQSQAPNPSRIRLRLAAQRVDHERNN